MLVFAVDRVRAQCRVPSARSPLWNPRCDISGSSVPLNPIVSPRWILSGEAHDGIHDDLSDSWSAGLPFVTGIKLPGDELTMPPQDGIRREDGRDFPQSFATDGMSLHGKQATLVIVEQQSLLSELFQQGLDLGVLELNDLLLPLVHKAAEGRQQDVPWLEDGRHVRRRNWAVSDADG